jgi:hypothetical protein
MRSIRRLYFYLVALISLEVVLWGLINLLRTTFSTGLTFPGADTLAQALALILVGLPIFAVHWLWAQNVSAKDPEEHSAMLRAVFLYAVLLMTLVPVVQNILALINRTLVVTAGIDSSRAFLGGTQSWVDNLIAILFNLVAAAYFFSIARADWVSLSAKENFADVRRLYRFIWVLYALLMAIFGVQQVLRFLFYLPSSVIGEPGREIFINGLALIVVGTPIWVYTWDLCQNAVLSLSKEALDEPGERSSNLRLGVLYLLALAGVVAVLSSAGVAIDVVLRRLLGEALEWRNFLSQIGSPISVGVPLAAIWAYYGGWLGRQIEIAPDAPRRAGLKRFYLYILSLIGLVATFVGLALLASFVIDILTANAIWGDALRSRLSGSIATLLAGLPLWLFTWRPMQVEAFASGDAGDHARRSIIRRTYLYLVIFATVIGGMASAIFLVYTVLFGILDHRSDSFLQEVLNGIQLLGLFSAFLIYHWTALRQDGSHAADALAARQAGFAVIVFESDGTGFASSVEEAIQRVSPSIPVAALAVEQGLPEGAGAAQAVVLPSTLALNPPEALRLWLNDYAGHKIIVPVAHKGWYWPGGAPKNGSSLAAQIVRQLAEGQEVRSSVGSPVFQAVAYVFAVLFGLQLLFLLFGFGISMVVR